MTGKVINVLLVALAISFFVTAWEALPRDGSASREDFVLGMLGGLCLGLAIRGVRR